jgi:hypothetical protein
VAVAQLVEAWATSREVVGSIPDGIIAIFIIDKSFRLYYGPGID